MDGKDLKESSEFITNGNFSEAKVYRSHSNHPVMKSCQSFWTKTESVFFYLARMFKRYHFSSNDYWTLSYFP